MNLHNFILITLCTLVVSLHAVHNNKEDIALLEKAITESNLGMVDVLVKYMAVEETQKISLIDYAQNIIDNVQLKMIREKQCPESKAAQLFFTLFLTYSAVSCLLFYTDPSLRTNRSIILATISSLIAGFSLASGTQKQDYYKKNLETLRDNAIAIKRKLYELQIPKKSVHNFLGF